MARNSPIEWTDHTFNPWWGCTKVSPGCQYCYAERLSTRYGHDVWGPGAQRRTFGTDHWEQLRHWNAEAGQNGRPSRVFCASMADVFEEYAPPDQQERLWSAIERTPNLRWQLLTKRPERILGCIPRRWKAWPPQNVWYGTSIESKDYYWRIKELRRVPAAVRFLSVEPLLGPVGRLPLAGIHWVILGGESGPSSRPMDEEWALAVKDRCRKRGVPFFFKQWGGRNKKEAGRILAGRTFDEFPKAP